MKPVICQVKHNPPESYGDCVRACVASVLERDDVPHFFENGDGDLAFDLMREYLSRHGLIPAYFPISGEAEFSEVGTHMMEHYRDTTYLMFCSNRDGDHCVVGCNDKMIHDPGWYKTTLGPHSSGVWIIIILAKV